MIIVNMGMHWTEAAEELSKMVSMPRMGLVTDMDGTISHIVDKPEEAVVSPRNFQLLEQLKERLPLVSIVSGRSVRSVTARMALSGVVYVGNHGLESYVDGQVKRNFDLADYRPMLEASVVKLKEIQLEGIQVEDKGATITLHYRQTEDPDYAREFLLPIVERLADDKDLDYFEGRMIFELRPPVDADKGTAFRKLVHDYALDSAIYVGDDTTDLAALKMAKHLRKKGGCYALGVAVVCEGCPDEMAATADMTVSGVPDVENLFAWILDNLN